MSAAFGETNGASSRQQVKETATDAHIERAMPSDVAHDARSGDHGNVSDVQCANNRTPVPSEKRRHRVAAESRRNPRRLIRKGARGASSIAFASCPASET
jgi:hypothetical protein